MTELEMKRDLIATEQRLKEANDYIEKLETALLRTMEEATRIHAIAKATLESEE